MSQRALSYQYEELLKYQNINNAIPQHLVPYCVQETNGSIPDISIFEDQLSSVISSITKGDNPNNVIFVNFVKLYVNMIHQGNYQEYLQKLKGLDYSSRENIHFLASELIICAIRCPISVKGFKFDEDQKYKSVPEICADIAKQFSSLVINSENKNISFHEEMMKMCQQYFMDFVDLNRSLDENNENTSDNYKGFMTFMGLLYSRGIINIKVVIDCIDSIKRSIFCSDCQSKNHFCNTDKHTCPHLSDKLLGFKKQADNKLYSTICYYDCNEYDIPSETNQLITHRKHIECVNLHKGYEHLLTHVIHSLESRISELISNYNEKKTVSQSGKSEDIEQYKTVELTIHKICEYIDTLIKSHQEMINLNKFYKSTNKNQLVLPFKPYVVITHNSLGSSLNKLREKLIKYSVREITEYKNVSLAK